MLLLCNDTLQPFSGGGATLRGLFSDFPPAALFSVHHDGHPPESGRLRTSHRLTNDDVRYLQPVGLVHSLSKFFRTASTAQPRATDSNGPASALPAPRMGSGVRSLLSQAGYLRLSPTLLAAIRDFKPDVLYGWIGDPLWGRTLTWLAAELRVPYVVHFMDNHIGLALPADWTGRVSARLFRRQIDRAVAGAASVLAISDAMAEAYGERWRRPVCAFHGVMRTEGWPAPGARPSRAVCELAFTGSIEQGQVQGLLDVARAVEQLCATGPAVRLVLYTTEYYRNRVEPHFAKFPNVAMRSHPASDALRAALVESEALILAYGFDQTTIDYYRYSFPTKIVPYMLSGTPVLAYGPQAIAPMAYASSGGWAKVVMENSVDALAAALRDLLRDPAERLRLGTLAHAAARREHDQAVVAVRFADALRAAAVNVPA